MSRHMTEFVTVNVAKGGHVVRVTWRASTNKVVRQKSAGKLEVFLPTDASRGAASSVSTRW